MIRPAKRVKTPVILQLEAVECGAAALAIILGYHKLFLPLEKVRADCGVSRDGSQAINMVKAARKYGMVAKGLRKDVDGLRDLEMPVILHWNFNHFIVLEGFTGDKAYINDPAIGRRTVKMEELNQSFTGIVLSITPGNNFRPSGSRTNIKSLLIPKIKPEIIPLIYLIIAGVAMLIPGIALPVANSIFFDDIVLANRSSLLYPLLLYMSFFVVLQLLISWARETCLAQWENDLSFRLSRTFFHKILFLPVSFFDQRYAGEISSRVELNNQVSAIICGKGATAVLDIFISIVYLILLFILSTALSVVACFIAIGNLVFLSWISSKRIDLSRKLILEQGKISGVAYSGIGMIESLKASGKESEFFERWAGHHAQYINTERSVSKTSSMMAIVPVMINGLGTTAILAVGSNLIFAGSITIGFFFAYQALLANFLMPIQRLINVGGDLSELEGTLQRLADVERNIPDDKKLSILDSEPLTGNKQRKLDGYVEFKDITFGYSPLEAPLLDNFSFSLKPGSRVALVGPSGCGKSTIARLMAGLYEPWSGEILIDGKKISEIPKQQLYLSLAFVNQEIFIFEGTVRDNITLWDKTLPDAKIIQAAKDAEIHDLISSLSKDYDHPVSEGGRDLSGGQKQRLEIARAIAKDPSILVLDEATSALDALTEKQIEHNLRKRGCTCLIIAHRLSTIRDCDNIIVLDKGKIVEEGTHQQLMKNKGPYFRLITAEEEA